jgi:hypothetical protein
MVLHTVAFQEHLSMNPSDFPWTFSGIWFSPYKGVWGVVLGPYGPEYV